MPWLKIPTLLFHSLLQEAKMFQWTQFIVHMVVLLLSSVSFCLAENVYCVRPTGTSCSPCPHKSFHCATLSEYAQQANLYFTSNSTMVFLPGDHTLGMNITVTNISRLTMSGESSLGYLATVVCNGSVGLSFMSMVDFKIHSLTFTACGRSFDEYYAYALLLESQARSQGGFEGVRTNPPCSLAKFIFNETAAVQGSHHAAATRGSHIHVACRSVCDRDQEF